MQVEKLILYSRSGVPRELNFRVGQLNVITGDSQTGKSSLTNILRYCLGSRRPDVPFGPISNTVAWYGLFVQIGTRRLFLGRPAADGAEEVSAALLLVEPQGVPSFDNLQPNTTATELQEYLAGAIGIEENLNVPAIGQTRSALAANFVHSLYYCFQTQGEIANPAVLFHHQNLEWQAPAIRDTLPYFLGAQGLDELRRRQRLTEQRRALRVAEQRLVRAQADHFDGEDRALGLVVEANDAGLLRPDEGDGSAELNSPDARTLLLSLIDRTLEPGVSVGAAGAEFENLRLQLTEQRERGREIVEELRGLESFSEVAAAYARELGEHRARLVSIGLVPNHAQDASCPVCGSAMSAASGDTEHQAISAELSAVSRRLDLAGRDRPRVEKARSELLDERDAVLQRIAELNRTLSALAETNDLVARERQRVNMQSYVRGKIAEYLGSIVSLEPSELETLRGTVARLQQVVRDLEESLDPARLRSQVDSAIARISRDVTAIAQRLGLEHSADGVRIDPNRLTVVADTAAGPAYLDAGHIGSGLNWVGYHLAVYLALHRYFIERDRPVPRFVLVDQPSQAFFPPDRQAGGDLDEMSDTDREHTKDLYQLMYDEVAARDGALQLIVLDHADFSDQWFQDSVIERWRDGDALIPSDWLIPEGLFLRQLPSAVINSFPSARADARIGSFGALAEAAYTDPDPLLQPAVARINALIERTGTGDQYAFEELYRIMLPASMGVARRVLKSGGLVEDAINEAAFRVWRAARHFSPGNGRAWYLAIVRNIALRFARARERSDVTSPDLVTDAAPPGQPPVFEGTSLHVSEGEAQYLARMTQESWFVTLNRREQRIVLLRYLGFTNSEIRRMLSDVTHDEIIRRAMKRAAESYREENPRGSEDS